ncbi:MAG: hypothetical protein LBH62_09280 [Nitrososphaerota archaeon]|jgi:hypothetical protein|nr:hypothetical protein [Nitrososphaerota archaeon]
MAKFLNDLPPTKEGAKLNLTSEQEEKCKAVYKKDDKGGAYFAGLYNPEVEYSDEYVIVPLKSIYKGITAITYATNTCFANIEGSSYDRNKSGGTWLSVVLSYLPSVRYDCYATQDLVYDPVTNMPITAFRGCSPNDYVGGHILLGTNQSGAVAPGNDVHLLPICRNHNIAHFAGHPVGGGFYMKLKYATKAVIFEGYLIP